MSEKKHTLSEAEKMLAAGYVLGDLTSEETLLVEQLAARHPAFLKELHAQQTSFELIPQALAKVEPPAHLFAQIAVASSRSTTEKDGPEEGQRTPTPETIPTRPHRLRSPQHIFQVLAGLLTLAALGLGLDNLRLRNQLQLVQQSQPERVASILQQPNSRLISLTGNNNNAAGTLLFTPGRWQEVIVSLGDLPPLPPDQIYRMWLALENSEVIHCGTFNTDSEGKVFVRFTPDKSPPAGVKATELFVTIDANTSVPEASGPRVMGGAI